MNDTDDYDFGASKKSTLSSLFEKENSHEIGKSSLVYKPEKQPTNDGTTYDSKTSTLSKSYYKYINLFEVTSDKLDLGKHVLALIRSDANPSLILIYQTKTNILIRKSVGDRSIYSSPENNCRLYLLANEKKWLLEFGNDSDFKDFYAQYLKFGGVVEQLPINDRSKELLLYKKTEPILYPSSVLSNLKESQVLSSILDPIHVPNHTVNGIPDTDFSGERTGKTEPSIEKTPELKEKENILARLAKMGLPQLPSFENDETCTNKVQNPVSEKLKGSRGKNQQNSTNEAENASDIKHKNLVEYKNEIVPVTSSSSSHNVEPPTHSTSQSFNQIQMLSGSVGQVDQLSIILAESRINNAEIKHYISSLTKEVKEMFQPTGSSKDHLQNELESRLKAFQLKAENLEIELNRTRKNYMKLQKTNSELSSIIESSRNSHSTTNMIDSASQTVGTPISCETEKSIYKSQLMALLNLFTCLQIETTDIDLSLFKNMLDQIEDDELSLCFESTINKIEEMLSTKKCHIDSNLVDKRNHFIKETKKIMSDMYSNICLSFDEECDNKNTVANQIRNVTAEIVKNYDKSIENNFMK